MRICLLGSAWAFVLVTSAAALFAADPQLSGHADAPTEPLSLWYRQPAAKWVEALAIGNGRLGAMVFGGINREQLQLNEGTLWAGGPYDPVNPQAREALPEARRLVSDGKYSEAAKFIMWAERSKSVSRRDAETQRESASLSVSPRLCVRRSSGSGISRCSR